MCPVCFIVIYVIGNKVLNGEDVLLYSFLNRNDEQRGKGQRTFVLTRALVYLYFHDILRNRICRTYRAPHLYSFAATAIPVSRNYSSLKAKKRRQQRIIEVVFGVDPRGPRAKEDPLRRAEIAVGNWGKRRDGALVRSSRLRELYSLNQQTELLPLCLTEKLSRAEQGCPITELRDFLLLRARRDTAGR